MNMKVLIAVAVVFTFGAGMTAPDPAQAQSVTSAPAPSENLVQLQERVDELERMLRQATSENERVSIELRRARNENARLERLLNDAVAQSQTPDGAGDASSPAQSGPAPPPGISGNGASGNLGSLPPGAVANDGSQTLREAMRLLQLGRFPEAEAAFATFVRTNPQSPDTPEARYFVGRTQVAQRHFADAGDTFVKLLADHPNIVRAPDSWVMLGVSLNGMGKKPEACGVFRDLITKYPRASVSTRNVAAVEARNAQCPAR